MNKKNGFTDYQDCLCLPRKKTQILLLLAYKIWVLRKYCRTVCVDGIAVKKREACNFGQDLTAPENTHKTSVQANLFVCVCDRVAVVFTETPEPEVVVCGG